MEKQHNLGMITHVIFFFMIPRILTGPHDVVLEAQDLEKNHSRIRS
jgi:hypothetical protein